MKRVIFVLLLCTASVVVRAREIDSRQDSLLVMFWNLENFFDWIDQGTGDSDNEFSSQGSRHWTRSRFYVKCNSVAKSLFWIADNYGRMPDVFGVCEIENRGVLDRLLSSTLLRKFDYDVVHFDSEDRRGIDVALLYRKSSFELISVTLKTPISSGQKIRTRDMLHARMKCMSFGDTLDFIVCHHPSKYGGTEQSNERRIAAMTALADLCDSLGGGRKVVMGDFNDTPSSMQFDMVSDILVNKAGPLASDGLGSLRYKGKWELIDMFMVDDSIDSFSQMEIVNIPFLMTYDRTYPGLKPLRTFLGPKYIGGVSDHCPVILKILLPLRDFR